MNFGHSALSVLSGIGGRLWTPPTWVPASSSPGIRTRIGIGRSVNGLRRIGNLWRQIELKSFPAAYGRLSQPLRQFGANGLSGWQGLGLLSDAVGLMRSCVEFQEVIVFPGARPPRQKHEYTIDSLFSALLGWPRRERCITIDFVSSILIVPRFSSCIAIALNEIGNGLPLR